MTQLLTRPDLFELPIDRCFWFYGIHTHSLPQQPNVQTIAGLPDLNMLKSLCGDGSEHTVVVLDDLLTETIKNKDFIAELFLRVSHHMNISFFLLAQSLFEIPRLIRVQLHYLISFKSVSDRLNLINIGKQMFAGQLPYYLASVDSATAKKHSYIVITAHPREDQAHFRLCSDLLGVQKVYLPK